MTTESAVADGITVRPPAPGRALLACRCGAVLDARDMRRRRPRPTQSARVIQPIVCEACT